MDGQVYGIPASADRQTVFAGMTDEHGVDPVDPHLDELIFADRHETDAVHRANELRRDAMDACADELFDREVDVTGLHEAADVRHRHVGHRHPDDVVGGEVAVAGGGRRG